MGIGIHFLIWPVAVAAFGLLGRHALDMLKEKKYREMWGWWSWSLSPFVAASLIWVASQGPSEMERNIVLGIIGAFFGGCILIWAGYLVQAQVVPQPPNKPPTDTARPSPGGSGTTIQSNQSGPNINAPGGQVHVYQAPVPRPRDPDTLYQLDNSVGTVERAAVDLSNGIVTFDLIRGAMNLNLDSDFQYRNYVLHVNQFVAEMGNRESPQGRWLERRLARVVCRIVDVSPAQ